MDDRRLIEDFLPIQHISKEASREKSLRHGHISTLHLWWARRPLVACRAAVYASLVPADWHAPKNGTEKQKKSLARANATKFLTALCKYPGDPRKLEEARQHILEAHRLRTGEDGPPKVLDCFAGGGSIPLEALRLGCEAYALELNPVAYLILLCTVVYPQKFGQPDPATGWKGLAAEVEYWGQWVLERVKQEVGDLYLTIPDPEAPPKPLVEPAQREFNAPGFESRQRQLASPGGTLTPVAYLWTRTVRCKNPRCGAVVPLVRQTWLCKKAGRFIALKVTPGQNKRPCFSLVESHHRREEEAVQDLGFDPGKFSRRGNAVCVFCGTVADSDYVKQEARAGRMGRELMAVVCTRPGHRGKVYLAANQLPSDMWPDDSAIRRRIESLCEETGLTVPEEPLPTRNDSETEAEEITLGFRVQPYGFTQWADLFTPRQLLTLLTFVKGIRQVYEKMVQRGYEEEQAKAVATTLGLWVDKVADYSNSLCRWLTQVEALASGFGRQALPMVWDFPEVNPFGDASGNAENALQWVVEVISQETQSGAPAQVVRGTITQLPYPDAYFDAVITDPPYYDNVPYADLSDFFYVWLKRSVGQLHPEHFATDLTPKRSEVIADPYRQEGPEEARRFYERMMEMSLTEIRRALKPSGILTMVYAHKTVAGWETLVDALRKAGFLVTEAWPLETERSVRLRAMDSSALASSIFVVARKREKTDTIGNYTEVRQELEAVVRERVEALWGEGIGGADLLVACVGAGLKAYTQYARIELPNGEEVPAGRFLREVEGIVQEVLLEKLFRTRAAVSLVDAPTRFYVLWRYFYGRRDLEAGDAIVFAYPLHVELDGPRGLATGRLALLEKKGSKYHLRDFSERGDNEDLGLEPRFGLTEPPLIDVLHRLLWLVEYHTPMVPDFLSQAVPDAERLRLVAQVLAGSGLQGGLRLTTEGETSALQKLVSNWETLVEGGGPLFQRRR